MAHIFAVSGMHLSLRLRRHAFKSEDGFAFRRILMVAMMAVTGFPSIVRAGVCGNSPCLCAKAEGQLYGSVVCPVFDFDEPVVIGDAIVLFLSVLQLSEKSCPTG